MMIVGRGVPGDMIYSTTNEPLEQRFGPTSPSLTSNSLANLICLAILTGIASGTRIRDPQPGVHTQCEQIMSTVVYICSLDHTYFSSNRSGSGCSNILIGAQGFLESKGSVDVPPA